MKKIYHAVLLGVIWGGLFFGIAFPEANVQAANIDDRNSWPSAGETFVNMTTCSNGLYRTVSAYCVGTTYYVVDSFVHIGSDTIETHIEEPNSSYCQPAAPQPTPAAPTLSISASPSTVSYGNSSTISWSSENTTSCIATDSWSGGQSLYGNYGTGSLTSPENYYTLTCTGPGGSVEAYTKVDVTKQETKQCWDGSTIPKTSTCPAQPKPTASISASPSSVTSGGASTLTWSSENATSCTLSSGSWSSSVGVNGSGTTGSLNEGRSYTFTCTNAAGSASDSTSISVTAPVVQTPTPTPTPVPTPDCTNGAKDYPTCTPPKCVNGAPDYPKCTPTPTPVPTPDCTNGGKDYPTCTAPTCTNKGTNYPTCTPPVDDGPYWWCAVNPKLYGCSQFDPPVTTKTCSNGAKDYPTCTPLKCTNGASDYPTCTEPKCANGASDYPTCTPPTCSNGASDYPTCTPPEPEPEPTQTCWDGSVIPVSQSCPIQTKSCWDGSVIPVTQSCPPRPPSATLQFRINGGAWKSAAQAIESTDTIDFQWSSSYANSCGGANFNTGGATSGTATNVTKPAVGNSTTYSVQCPGASGTSPAVASVKLTTRSRKPILTPSSLIVKSGSKVTMSYDLNGNASCTFSTADSVLSGVTVTTSGAKQTAALTKQTAYTLTCDTNNTASVTINVEGAIKEQ